MDFVTQRLLDECKFTAAAKDPMLLAQFVRRFRETWDRLPSSVRHTLLTYWKSDSEGILNQSGDNLVLVVFDWTGRRTSRPVSGATYAQAGQFGYFLRFSESAVEHIPENHLQTLIAHELGHIVLIAEKEPNHMVSPDAKPEEIARAAEESERLVGELIEQWGFDHDGLLKWLDEHGSEMM